MIYKDAFYEESASSVRSNREAKFYTAFTIVAIVFIVIAAVWLTFSVSFISSLYAEGITETQRIIGYVQWFSFPAACILVGVVLLWVRRRFNLSFDYTFVEDELRVTKVFNGKRRKFLVTLKADQILKVGKCENESFGRTMAGMNGKKLKLCTPNYNRGVAGAEKEFFYILHSSSIEKAVYVIECRAQMIDYVVRAAGRNKWEAK